ncbi:hypothetical protein AM501_07295 [Aneurinibacillus migulanus]|uniref:UPF0316 protein AF333_13705 n=1 Tax=Aneurinibacillus migulanus TaxID=47500 RepID=A0A0M0H2R2_ANEMI|nr:DUF2179 domain-containing protein [Aneurinibacillus migulanus]KON96374.1 hypothetical protein AF333_13705 [Aneurinibacillus migulanus]KPD08912.1 hypothetical protein AM501_07295 [Aneurinibacillus migulanus]MCP1356825.1 DUF2179 domain-containing protein [Aneurinibacillus migulanus]MED0892305.1 DUF2179 domain-containing protein [Aneurinibacillus migulanus]MED1615743.1 DUF2179 domain-containing protein [Aneurinibacillus migulanus]
MSKDKRVLYTGEGKAVEQLLIIFTINIVYVSFFTIRMIMVMKGQKLLASFISTIEVFIYLMGLSLVLDSLDNPFNLAAYCIGWGTGVYMGSKIEEMLALGYVTVQIVLDSAHNDISRVLREKGYGVTSWEANGKDGQRVVMNVLAKRRNEKKLYDTIKELAPKAFVISYEPKFFHGGFWTKRITK